MRHRIKCIRCNQFMPRKFMDYLWCKKCEEKWWEEMLELAFLPGAFK